MRRPVPALVLLLPSCLLGEGTPQGPLPPRQGWDVSLGALGLAAPASPGSNETRSRILPFIKADYSGKLFIGSNPAVLGLGMAVRALERGPIAWDLGLGYAEGRREKRAAVLTGMGDQSGSLWAGTALKCGLGPMELYVSGGHGLAAEAGNRLKLGLGSHLPLGARWIVGAHAALSAADRKGMAYQFGVDATQAATRQALLAAGDTRLRAGEDREYSPAGGWSQADLGLMTGCRLTGHWSLMGMITGTRLLGQAAGSPLVRRQDTLSAGFGVHYHF